MTLGKLSATTVPIIVAILVVIGTLALGFSSSVTADDQFAEHCDSEDAEPVPPGNYGNLLSPTDRDVLVVNVSEGDFISVNLSYDAPRGSKLLIYGDAGRVSFSTPTGENIRNASNFAGGSWPGHTNDWSSDLYQSERTNQELFAFGITPGTTQFRAYAESGRLCISFHTTDDTSEGPDSREYRDSGAGGAGTWQLSFSVNDADPPVMISNAELEALRNNTTTT